MSTMDEGKCNSLFELAYFTSKEGGYTGNPINIFQQMSTTYFIPMISALVGQRLVTQENEFDEALYVLEQYSPKCVHDQLNKDEAKKGSEVEIMKFFAALAYEFRSSRPGRFTQLCEYLSRINQLHIAHFISYMDNATKAENTEWWKVLFLPYSDDDLNKMGVSICGNAVQTPHKTPSRNLLSEKNMFESPVGMVINSPNGKDRLIQEFERRLQAERSMVQSLQADYEESSDKILKMKAEIEVLKEKLEKANKNVTTVCGEDCSNKAEVGQLRVRLNVRENKIQQLNADLIVAREELDNLSDTNNKFRLENRQMEEKVKFLTDENERLSSTFNEVLELRQKLANVIKEKEDLIISHTNDNDIVNRTQLLQKEIASLKGGKTDLENQLSSKENTIIKLKFDLEQKEISIGELKVKLEVGGVSSTELAAVKSEKEHLVSECETLKAKNKELSEKAASSEKMVDDLEEELKIKKVCIANLTTQLNRSNKSSEINNMKPIKEPVQLIAKSLTKPPTTFTVPGPFSSSGSGGSASLTSSSRYDASTRFKTALNGPHSREFKYDNSDRLNILRDRNQKTAPHLRSHYAVEQDANFSPSDTMKFSKKQ